jgi:hypothetical protein
LPGSFFVDYQELRDRSEDALYRLIAFDETFVERLRGVHHQRIVDGVRQRLTS